MVESIAELRRRVQEPVRRYNDIAGLLLGDRLSIHVTRAFLVLGLSPTVGTISMLVFGVGGSVLAAFGGWWAVAGFACVFLYYIFDCVDGEVARYHKGEKLVWGFHDFLFHLWVKSAFFVGVGIHAYRVTDRVWVLGFAAAALLATLWTKFLFDVSMVLATRYIVGRAPAERERFVRQIAGDALTSLEAPIVDQAADPRSYVFSSPVAFLRSALVNFDLSTVFFLAASIASALSGPVDLAGLRVDWIVLLLAWYGFALTVDFFDRWWTCVRTGGFTTQARETLRRAHHFRLR
jgi:hypothetical protein